VAAILREVVDATSGWRERDEAVCAREVVAARLGR
jgi:hypothetical protein